MLNTKMNFTAPDRLYYYLSAKNLENVLTNGQIRAYNIYQQNDKNEVRLTYEMMVNVAQERIYNLFVSNRGMTAANWMYRWLKAKFDPAEDNPRTKIFIRSFAELPDDAGLWKSYTGNTGVCLTFNGQKLAGANTSLWLLPVEYDISAQRKLVQDLYVKMITENLKHYGIQPQEAQHFPVYDPFLDDATRLLASTKYSGWSSEQEWRFISRRLNPDDSSIQVDEQGREFIEISLGSPPLCEFIRVGPKISNVDRKSVAALASTRAIPVDNSLIKL
jgi:hypothetical protein